MGFPMISQKFLKLFKCTSFADPSYPEIGQYLDIDLSIECFTPRYFGWATLAGIGLIHFTFGIPIFFAYQLITHRKVLAEPDTVAKLGFLYKKYEPEWYGWELVEMSRKLLLTSVIIFIEPGSSTQIIAGMLISFFMLILHTAAAAYLEESDDRLQFAALLGIFMTLWGALIIRADLEISSGPDGEIFNALLLLLNLCPMVFGGLAFGLEGFTTAMEKLEGFKKAKKAKEAKAALKQLEAEAAENQVEMTDAEKDKALDNSVSNQDKAYTAASGARSLQAQARKKGKDGKDEAELESVQVEQPEPTAPPQPKKSVTYI